MTLYVSSPNHSYLRSHTNEPVSMIIIICIISYPQLLCFSHQWTGASDYYYMLSPIHSYFPKSHTNELVRMTIMIMYCLQFTATFVLTPMNWCIWHYMYHLLTTATFVLTPMNWWVWLLYVSSPTHSYFASHINEPVRMTIICIVSYPQLLSFSHQWTGAYDYYDMYCLLFTATFLITPMNQCVWLLWYVLSPIHRYFPYHTNELVCMIIICIVSYSQLPSFSHQWTGAVWLYVSSPNHSYFPSHINEPVRYDYYMSCLLSTATFLITPMNRCIWLLYVSSPSFSHQWTGAYNYYYMYRLLPTANFLLTPMNRCVGPIIIIICIVSFVLTPMNRCVGPIIIIICIVSYLQVGYFPSHTNAQEKHWCMCLRGDVRSCNNHAKLQWDSI